MTPSNACRERHSITHNPKPSVSALLSRETECSNIRKILEHASFKTLTAAKSEAKLDECSYRWRKRQ